MQDANSRATPSSPGRAAKQPQASTTSANAQKQISKRNAAAKKKVQEELAEQTALVEKLQHQLAVATAKGDKVAVQGSLHAAAAGFKLMRHLLY